MFNSSAGNNAAPTNDALGEIGKTSGWELALVTAPSNTNKSQVADTKMVYLPCSASNFYTKCISSIIFSSIWAFVINQAGGFDRSLLDSLYEDDVSRRQLQLHSAGYSSGFGYEMTPHNNVYNQRDPFAMTNNMSPQADYQMAMMSQQQQMMMHQQHMMMQQQQHNNMMMSRMMAPHSPYGTQYPQQQIPQMGSTNPFGDPFGYPQGAMPPHGNHTLL